MAQAEKFSSLQDSDDNDSVMDEDSMLETPLDKMEPYGMFRDSLLRLQQDQPPLYDSLTKILEPADQQFLQGVIQEAEIRSIAVQQNQETLPSVPHVAVGVAQTSPTRIGP